MIDSLEQTGNPLRGPRPPAAFARRLFVLALLLFVPVVVFWPICHHPFVQWDDDFHIYDNPALRPLSVECITSFWSAPFGGLYVPVAYTVFAFEAWLAMPAELDGASASRIEILTAPLDARVFHVTSLALHVGSVLLVFSILRRFVGSDWAACAGALLFAVHPLQVEPVAWASGTRDLLAGFFSLLAIRCYLSFAMPPVSSTRAPVRRAWWKTLGLYLAVVLCTLLGILSKPSAVAVPLILLVIEFLLLRRRATAILLSIAPLLLLVGAATLWTKYQQPSEALHHVTSIASRPRVAGDAVAFYSYKIALPWNLVADYARQPRYVLENGWTYATALLPYLALVGLAWWTWRQFDERRVWLAAGFIFLMALLPVLGFIPFAYQNTSTVADRYAYLAMLGVALAAALLLHSVARRWAIPSAVFIIVLCSALSYRQTQTWRDTETLFTHCLRICPQSFVAHNALGTIAAARGDSGAALDHFRAACHLEPSDPTAYACMADALLRLGQTDEAAELYRQVIKMKPASPVSHNNLATTQLRSGQLDEAIASFQEALKYEPTMVVAWLSLGDVLALQNRSDEAAEAFGRALALDPQLIEARLKILAALKSPHKRPEMIAALRRIVDSLPTNTTLVGALADELQFDGQAREAIARYRAALRMKPQLTAGGENVAWANNLAWILATNRDGALRNGAEAVHWARLVDQVTHGARADYLDTLAAAYAEDGQFEEAVKTAAAALRLPEVAADESAAQGIRSRLELYQAQRPYHEG